MDANDDIKYMEMALREAEKAADDGEVPTGCVIVDAEGRILGRAHNQTEGLADATAHAEMLALSAAFNAKGNWRLTGTTLYVTKEPCPMCAGAIVLARPDRVVWGVSDPKRGGSISSTSSGNEEQINNPLSNSNSSLQLSQLLRAKMNFFWTR